MIEAFAWLNNRDVSILIWMSFALLFVLIYKQTRPHIVDMVRIIVTSQIGTVFLLCITYTLAVILALQMNGFWEMPLMKEAIVWLFSFAFYSTFKANNQKNHFKYFKGLVWDAVKLTAILEFATNFYVMGFVGEMILVPVVVFMAMLIAYSEIMEKEDSKYSMTTKFFNVVITFIGLYVFYRGIMSFVNEPNALLSWTSFKEFILPAILTIFFIPILYAITFHMHFESFAVRLLFLLKKDKKLVRYAKCKMLLKSHFSIDRLKRMEDKIRGKFIRSKEEFNLLIAT